jgi:hypothetical protein
VSLFYLVGLGDVPDEVPVPVHTFKFMGIKGLGLRI